MLALSIQDKGPFTKRCGKPPDLCLKCVCSLKRRQTHTYTEPIISP